MELKRPDESQRTELRQQTLRRVNYAVNTIAVAQHPFGSDSAFDTALTNGLLAIVAHELPGAQTSGRHMRSARDLLTQVVAKAVGVSGFLVVDVEVLLEALNISQPIRHGRVDDEYASLHKGHLDALRRMDEHESLRILEFAESHPDRMQCVWRAYAEAADSYLESARPGSPGEPSCFPDPEHCESCGRWTFIPSGWDDAGGTATPGWCLACEYERNDEQAYDRFIADAWERWK